MQPLPAYVPPGWHPDPSGLPTQRWWDGSTWTDQLAPFPSVASTAPQAYFGGPVAASAPVTRLKVRARQHEAYGQLSLVSVLIPLIGFVLGIVYLAKPRTVDRKLGEHLIVCAIVANVILFAVLKH